MVRAITTRFKGHRYRSRLEARWAVLFDALGVAYEYEEQGYVVNGEPYLPDFVLEKVIHVEIKPSSITPLEFARAYQKLATLATDMCQPSLLVVGSPWPQQYTMHFIAPNGHLVGDLIGCSGCGSLAIRDTTILCAYRLTAARKCEWCEEADGMIIGSQESTLLVGAYEKARGARFEHGESGAA